MNTAKVALLPVLLWQAVRVRQRALELPEPAGARRGRVAGRPAAAGRPLRLLIVGDSSAAGVGVRRQSDALAGQLSQRLAEAVGRPVHWQLVARTGHTTGEALQHLRESLLQPADVLVTALGVNDVVRQVPAARTLEQLQSLHSLACERAGVRYWVHNGLPPLQDFPLLPAPLRWVFGAQAALLNQLLLQTLGDQPDRAFARTPEMSLAAAAAELMAEDGFHPGAAGYALWARHLAGHLARRLQRHAHGPSWH
ncbi:lysophospholipase L1-like esterase [Inhella inkyongensis]|uniref:Lysophospholipase L1-like esterase n=1 Tax=Inhella inkyongensis TaxID=392593 RepID=A0A840RZJ4_9BURK|nr:SGNH/GDSL hydrolase family protein [Inhella inkyongensis]MBB5203415.1 lysophospholipase L1-like esterase [Inhella inkyongensis]